MRISIQDIKAIQLSASDVLKGKLRFARRWLYCLALAGFACATVVSGTSFAQANSLSFGDNFFVTGDYIVAGAYNMTTKFSNGYAIGTFTIPDTTNKGIHGITSVPPGAEVVAALLYWQTVENAGTMPGQPGTGENGFFRPIIKNNNKAGTEIGPLAPGYPITGVSLPGHNNVSWSSGGCSEPQTGKITRTYRANVLGAFPQDAEGNVLTTNTPTENIQFEVRLPSVGPQTPLTLGATLVIIYRVLSPNVPLKSIVIYDGAFGQDDVSLNMTQTIQGFYDAGANNGAPAAVSKLTLIAGAGKSNKYQTVHLNDKALPSHAGGNQPPFPGWYGTWDNPTWTFGDPNYQDPGIGNPVLENPALATVQVVPSANGPGCLSWGAAILSTTVKNTDNDGLLDSWKTAQGYCDASINGGICQQGNNSDPGWVALPGAQVYGNGKDKDLFIQLDYMCSQTTGIDSCSTLAGTNNYSFDPRPSGAADLVTTAFSNHNIHVHINKTGPLGTLDTIQPVHAIQEQPPCSDIPGQSPVLCPFPGQVGVVGWKGGYAFFKNQLVETSSGNVANCLKANPPGDCQPRFQHGRKDSWHYALFAHAVVRAEWKIQDSTLSVSQSGNSVTFTTSTPFGNQIVADPNCTNGPANGRVSVYYASTNTSLNGTFCVQLVNGNTFTINVPVSGKNGTAYTLLTDPYLSVAPGQVGSASGVSDVGGSDSLITLGLWGNPASSSSNGQQENTIAGTFMHELGHSLGLTHGGFYYAAGSYVPVIEPNCKPNFQSVMNYYFQVDWALNGPLPDYSEQQLDPLNEASLLPGLTPSPLPYTKWYTPNPPQGVGTKVSSHCDGTPPLVSDPPAMFLVQGPATSPSWGAMSDIDIDFDGLTNPPDYDTNLRGYYDWGLGGTAQTGITTGIDLRQMGATGNSSVFSQANFFGGGQPLNGGGQPLNGGGQPLNGGGQPLNGGGQPLNGGGQPLNGGGEIDQKDADSYTRPPTNVMASEGPSPRKINLTWTASSFGQIGMYKVYQSEAGRAFIPVTLNPPNALTGNPPPLSYTDTVTCDPNGYRYFVTAVLSSTSTNPGQESVASNIVSTGSGAGNDGGNLTGCYNVTGPSVHPSGTQGTVIPITWTLTDDFNTTGTAVNNLAANTLVALGPGGTHTTLVSKGQPTAQAAGTFTVNSGQFTFSWDTDPFPAGSYSFELDLDSGQTYTSSALTLGIDVNDNDTPQITTVSLFNGVVGMAYTNLLSEEGGTGPFTWGVVFNASNVPPAGITLNSAGTLSGTSCVAGPSSFTVQVTDSDTPKNSGTRPLSLTINQATTTTSVSSNATPAVYGQIISFPVTVAPNSPCIPTGTIYLLSGGIQIASSSITSNNNGTATFMTSLPVGTYNITSTYGGDGNFVNSAAPGFLTQVVNKANTSTSVAVSPTSTTLGDVVTLTATVGAVLPGAGTPSGLVTFFDNGTPIGTGTLNGVSGMDQATFTTSLLSVAASPHSITVAYGGDANFNGSTCTAAATETVTLRGTTVGLTFSPSPVTVGNPSTATVTLTDHGITNPAGTADSWIATSGTPVVGTSGSTATLFADGMVLVAGGTSTSGVVANAYIYNATSKTFTAAGNLIAARTAATATLLPNGEILIAGGSSDGTPTGALRTAELYNPVTGTFTVAGSGSSNKMIAARFEQTATLLPNGEVLIAGGENSVPPSSAELYNPATDTFTPTGNSLTSTRYGDTATLLGNGQVLIAGGQNSGGVLNSAELYDPNAGTFTITTGSMSTARMGATATLLLSGKVLIAGGSSDGSTSLDTAELYDPTGKTFTVSNSTLKTARFNHSATLLPSGMVLLVGGASGNATELYDPDSDKFAVTGNMVNGDQTSLTATLLNQDNVLITGLTTGGPPAADAELYTPSFHPLGTVGLKSSDTSALPDVFGGPCVLMIGAGGVSTCTSTVTPGEVGATARTHTITGTYSADSVHSGNTGSAVLLVKAAPAP